MSMRKWTILLACTLVGGVALASSGGAPASRTGVPAIAAKTAESTCMSCHSGSAVNTGGTIEFVNAPPYFTQGTTYTFTVQLSSSQTSGNAGRRWGFELTAVTMTDGNGVGTFANVAGQGTKIVTGSGQYSTRQYIEQSTGTHMGEASPVQWQVQWTAPTTAVGSVGFFATGIAGNGSGGSGDFVYSTSLVLQDVTPTRDASWGAVKALYR